MAAQKPPNILARVRELLFYLLILLFPSQIGYHFWFNFSRVYGMRIDYLAPTLYLDDVLIILILVTWLFSERKWLKIELKRPIFFILLTFLIINIYQAKIPQLALLGFLKFAKLGFFALFMVQTRIVVKAKTAKLLGWGVVFSGILAAFQFIIKKNVGGVFWYLGERSFSLSTPAIAKVLFADRLLLRPYATFPHPNVLAAYFITSLIFILSYYGKDKTIKNILFYSLFFSITFLGIFLSFSRHVWLATVLNIFIILIWYFFKSKKKFFLVMPFLITGLILLINHGGKTPDAGNYLLQLRESGIESVYLRQELFKAGSKMIREHFLFGVGINNFIPNLPEYLDRVGGLSYFQPAHNVYLLISAEAGLIGFLFSMFFFYKIIKQTLRHCRQYKFIFKIKNRDFFLILSVFTMLFLGLFDHYFYTLQQTQLLAALVLASCWVRININNKKI